jgi:NOL1/NOP2/fmu family ribosome biogenesis protein
MKISDVVYNCLINQAIVLKHDSKVSGNEIAKNIVEEYFRGDDLNPSDKAEIISRISNILGD